MKWSAFPPRIRALEPYGGRFDAFRLTAQGCDVLFGTYPGGTRIERHTHPTDNWGVITKGEMVIAHSAKTEDKLASVQLSPRAGCLSVGAGRNAAPTHDCRDAALSEAS